MASSGGHADIVRLLLEKGANTEAHDKVINMESEREYSVFGEYCCNSLPLNECTKILVYFT